MSNEPSRPEPPAAPGLGAHPGAAPGASPDLRDDWLRSEGLPTLVPVRRWANDLPRRATPLMVWMCAFAGATVAVIAGLVAVDESLPEWAFTLYTAAALGVVLVVPVLLAYWVYRLLRRVRYPTLVSWVFLVVATVLTALITQSVDELSLFEELASGVITVLAVIAGIWIGLGSLLGWTLKSALTNLSAVRHMAAMALPVILLLVIFAFFSAETWQATDALSWPRLFAFGLVIVVIGTMVALPASWQEVAEARKEATESGQTAPALLRLRWWQQLNVVLVALISQLLLTAIFAAMLTAILVVLGKIAIAPPAMRAWLGHDAVPWEIGGATLPVTVNLLKAAVFLAMLAGLSFLISTVSDRQYREHFFDPIVNRIVAALAARPIDDTARGGRRAGSAGPAPAATPAAARALNAPAAGGDRADLETPEPAPDSSSADDGSVTRDVEPGPNQPG